MPAHLGFADKLNMFAAFMTVNLSQSEGARAARQNRVGTGNAGRYVQGLEGNNSNRAAYVAWKKVEVGFEHMRGRREFPIQDYGNFQRLLDNYNPDQQVNRTGLYSDQNEWNLYLRPGTAALKSYDRSSRDMLQRLRAVPPHARPAAGPD